MLKSDVTHTSAYIVWINDFLRQEACDNHDDRGNDKDNPWELHRAYSVPGDSLRLECMLILSTLLTTYVICVTFIRLLSLILGKDTEAWEVEHPAPWHTAVQQQSSDLNPGNLAEPLTRVKSEFKVSHPRTIRCYRLWEQLVVSWDSVPWRSCLSRWASLPLLELPHFTRITYLAPCRPAASGGQLLAISNVLCTL